MSKKFVVVFFLFAVFVFFVFTPSSFATSFDLIPPTGNLQQGQDITFTINIDTEGASITSVQSGLTFDSTLLQYVSVTAGAAMNTVVVQGRYCLMEQITLGIMELGYLLLLFLKLLHKAQVLLKFVHYGFPNQQLAPLQYRQFLEALPFPQFRVALQLPHFLLNQLPSL